MVKFIVLHILFDFPISHMLEYIGLKSQSAGEN